MRLSNRSKGELLFLFKKEIKLRLPVSACMILCSTAPALASPVAAATAQTQIAPGPALPVNIMNTEQQTNAVHAKIKVTDLTGKHATLSWDSGSPFAIYNVYQYDYILKSWSLHTQVRVNTVELTDLTPGHVL